MALVLIVTASLAVSCTTVGGEPEIEKMTAPVVDEQGSDVSPDHADQAMPLSEEWPKTFSRKSLSATVNQKARVFFESRVDRGCATEFQMFVENELEYRSELDTVIGSFVSIFCDYLVEDIVVAVGSYQFAKDSLAQTDTFLDEYGGICGKPLPGWSTGCALQTTVWVGQDESTSSAHVTRTLAHELFHVAQDSTQISVEPTWRTSQTKPLFVLHWFVEGSAEVFDGVFLDYLELSDYEDSILGDNALVPGGSRKPQLDQLETGWSMSTYEVGQFGAEYLIASTSFESLLEVFLLRNDSVTFDEAMLSITGMSTEDFYELVRNVELQ